MTHSVDHARFQFILTHSYLYEIIENDITFSIPSLPTFKGLPLTSAQIYKIDELRFSQSNELNSLLQFKDISNNSVNDPKYYSARLELVSNGMENLGITGKLLSSPLNTASKSAILLYIGYRFMYLLFVEIGNVFYSRSFI